jgi:hypothetical protein
MRDAGDAPGTSYYKRQLSEARALVARLRQQ